MKKQVGTREFFSSHVTLLLDRNQSKRYWTYCVAQKPLYLFMSICLITIVSLFRKKRVERIAALLLPYGLILSILSVENEALMELARNKRCRRAYKGFRVLFFCKNKILHITVKPSATEYTWVELVTVKSDYCCDVCMFCTVIKKRKHGYLMTSFFILSISLRGGNTRFLFGIHEN